MSNSKNKTVTPMDDGEISLKQVYDEIKSTRYGLMRKMDAVIGRIEHLEKSQTKVEKLLQERQIDKVQINARINEISRNAVAQGQKIEYQMQKKIDRLRRQNNLVIMGIEEKSSEVNTLASLFSIIWPQESFENRYTRVGLQKKNAAHPRPIRVEIPSFLEKKQMINNCRKLKGVTTLKGISVKNDMIKTQQQEHKERVKKKTRAYRY